MTRARLLILSFSHIAADARVLKQVRHFAETYDVTTCGYGPSPHPGVAHITLDDDAGFRCWRRRDLVLRRFPLLYHQQPAVRQARERLTALDRFDVVLANDIDTVGLALGLGPRYGVHADIHEYAPRQNEEQLVFRVFEAPYVRWMCRRFLTRAASMTTVGQGIADEYHRVFGLSAEVVTNAAPYADLTPREIGDTIRLVHSGASLRNRRLEVLVDAVKATRSDVTLDMYLMGNDPEYVALLRDRASSSDRIAFREPVPYAQLITRLNEYDVGVHVVAPTNFNNRWALPNKFFDYLQARLGIIIGPSAEMERILVENRLGAVAEGFDAESLTRALDALQAERVAEWKLHSDAAARPLSAERQVDIWSRAVAKLVDSAPR